MPKTSERQQTIKDLQLLIAFLSGEGKWDEVVEIAELLAHVEGSRFFGKRLARFHAKEFFLRTGLFANMHDDQFRTKFRTDRNSFNALCGLIQDHPIFSSNGNTCAQLPVPYQVAVAINRLGTYENAAGVLSLSTNFGISIGSVNNYTNRVVEAITDSCAHFLSWPDAEQRQEIRQVLAAEGFPGCVGFVDGSTLPLAWKRSLDGEVYFDRKKRYSINMQVVCDWNRCIIAMKVGHPGSVADSTVYKSMHPNKYPNMCFSQGEYLLGDSAYALSRHMIPNFKAPAANLRDNSEYNCVAAKCRVRNEHCTGILKGRFHWLRELRVHLRTPADVLRISKWVLACCILHNIFADLGDKWEEMAKADLLPDGDIDDDYHDDSDMGTLENFRVSVRDEALRINYESGVLPVNA